RPRPASLPLFTSYLPARGSSGPGESTECIWRRGGTLGGRHPLDRSESPITRENRGGLSREVHAAEK
ncbi:MAG: hypothetical protein M3Y80_03295, partial [Verrucomicrobiota bacterium]|nr:hypothetical protein [Verrucomicrobiota bacterium]